MNKLTKTLIVVSMIVATASANAERKVRVNAPFLDLNNNQQYDSGDLFVNLQKPSVQVAPYVTIVKDRKDPLRYEHTRIQGPSGAGFVVPPGAAIRAHQLEVIVDGDIMVNAGINTHYLDGNRIQLYGNIMGTLRLTSQNGRIVIGPEVKLKPDMVSLVAYGDIVLEDEARIFQFAKGFAKPLLRVNRAQYTTPAGQSLPLELGPQVIRSLNGNIILERAAEVDLNDRLDVIADNGQILLDSSSYLRARNKMLVLAKDGIYGMSAYRVISGELTLAAVSDDLSNPEVMNAVRSGSLVPTTTGVIQVTNHYGTRKGNQCKTGNGVVPECVQINPILHWIDNNTFQLNAPLRAIDK